MGWTYQERPAGQSVKDFFARKFSWDTPRMAQRLADCAVVDLRTAYLAVSQTEKETGRTLTNAVVCLLDYAPNDRFNQGFKDMEECMGPYEDRCPERILDLLSPADRVYGPGDGRDRAARWRERCRERIARRRARPSLKTGHFLLFEEPIRFANGEARALFHIRDARRRLFTDGATGRHPRRYRIPRDAFADRPYRVLGRDPRDPPTPPAEPRTPAGGLPRPASPLPGASPAAGTDPNGPSARAVQDALFA